MGRRMPLPCPPAMAIAVPPVLMFTLAGVTFTGTAALTVTLPTSSDASAMTVMAPHWLPGTGTVKVFVVEVVAGLVVRSIRSL